MDSTTIKVESIRSPVHFQVHGNHTDTEPQGLPPSLSCTSRIKQEDDQEAFVLRAAAPAVKTTKDKEGKIDTPVHMPPFDIEQEAYSEEDEEETKETLQTTASYPPNHSHVSRLSRPTPPPAPSRKPTKRSPKHPRLFLKLRCLRTLSLQSPPPQTPLNITAPLFMTPVRNSVRRAAFEDHVQAGVTPLLGKRSQSAKGKRRGKDVSDILREGREYKDERQIGSMSDGEKESHRLRWFKRRLWGRGRWAVRSKSKVRW